ncbi:hypothetical protein [Candidatus Stoquefichus massiliensis]|uniref:hypothetical protein n=1 Tax=Candidatus Stoquefichus massiliensis TaxID=1470350 RepID=UPI000481B28F|nr:hypothetical protein [Candidatus Stoquefichus massiliensis]
MRKLKITLACVGGVSTSILCDRIIEEGKSNGFEVECKAYATNALNPVAIGSDVILLGPQVCYMEDEVKKQFSDIPVRLISMMDYGTMNAKNIFSKLLNEFSW